MPETRIPVLIAGGGTVGLSAALFLAHQGVSTLLVEHQNGPSIHPRATGVGPRTVEFFREVGIEDAVNAAAIDMSTGSLGKISAETLAQADLASASATAPPQERQVAGPFDTVSPCRLRGTCPQDRLDPVLLAEAYRRGVAVHYSTRLVSFEQDNDGVTATLEGPAGRWIVRADYLVAADGVRSGVREALGIGMSGPGELGQPMINILFRADLSAYTKGATFVNCNITNPDARGMLMTVDGVKDWIFHTVYDPDAGETADDFTAARCRALIRAAIGDAELAVEVRSVLPWRVRGLLADRFADGRVFLAGDAAHIVPPIGAFGLNTGIADAHNLAWKLATVLRSHASPILLDSYEAERRPVAALTLEQAMLRLADPWLHWGSGPQAAAARAAAGVVHGPVVHLGYRYDSGAMIDAQPELPSTENVGLNLDGAPGSRLPHTRIEQDGQALSTLDLVRSRFTLLTGSGGDLWLQAAQYVSDRLGVKLVAHKIAPEASVVDREGKWPRIAGLAEDGAVLVRPDQFVAWRKATLSDHPADDLAQAFTRLLGRETRMELSG